MIFVLLLHFLINCVRGDRNSHSVSIPEGETAVWIFHSAWFELPWKNEASVKTLFTWSGGPRSSGVGFFCFVSARAWKQKEPNPTKPGSPTPCKQALRLLSPPSWCLPFLCKLHPSKADNGSLDKNSALLAKGPVEYVIKIRSYRRSRTKNSICRHK